jgi:hypothetical protein
MGHNWIQLVQPRRRVGYKLHNSFHRIPHEALNFAVVGLGHEVRGVTVQVDPFESKLS